MNTIKQASWLKTWRWPLAVILLALAGWGVKKLYFSKPTAPQVITAKAEVADVEDTVLATGTIEAVKEVSVGAQASGQLKRLYVDLGDSVRKGQLIAEIDSTTQKNTLRNAEAQLALLNAQLLSKRATLKQTELTYRRKQDLIKLDAASKADLEDAEAKWSAAKADVAVTEAQIKQADIAVDTAKVNLGYTRITAPIDGVVEGVITEEGQTVNALQSAPTIIKLTQLDTVQIKAQISEADVVRVKTGLPVYFTILGEPRHRYEAKLKSIEPSPESRQVDTSKTTTTTTSSTTAAVYYNGLFEVPNPDHKLRVAMTAQVFIVLSQVKDALVIPATALSDKRGKDERYEVRVLEGPATAQVVNTRRVRVGLNNRVQAQVLDGLKEGDLVVVGEATAGGGSGTGTRRPPGMF